MARPLRIIAVTSSIREMHSDWTAREGHRFLEIQQGLIRRRDAFGSSRLPLRSP